MFLFVFETPERKGNHLLDNLKDEYKVDDEFIIIDTESSLDEKQLVKVNGNKPIVNASHLPMQYKNIDISELNENNLKTIISSNKRQSIDYLDKNKIDHLIIACDPHIIFRDTVYTEFFIYSKMTKDEFLSIYLKNKYLVLNLKTDTISYF